MKTVAFTICSNNYLAQAHVLIKSVKKHNSSYDFYVFLVDKKNANIDYLDFDAKIVTIVDLNLERFDWIIDNYNIVELNTAIKPSCFKYLIKHNNAANLILYLDPDIKAFSSFTDLENKIKEHDILLTPHINTSIELDGLTPNEQTFQTHGIYNLGFLGVKANSSNVKKFLEWWEERCLKLCFINTKKGLFVDQLWVNYVPSFFDSYYILREYGYNMAPWNLHERSIKEISDDKIILNDDNKLVFYHFSSYNYRKPDDLCKSFYNRYNFENRKDLIPIYKDYLQELHLNNVQLYSSLDCVYIKKLDETEKIVIKKSNNLDKLLRYLLPPIVIDLIRKLKQINA
jgi:hypothetical protein